MAENAKQGTKSEMEVLIEAELKRQGLTDEKSVREQELKNLGSLSAQEIDERFK